MDKEIETSAADADTEGDGLDGGGLGHDLVQGFEPVGRLEGETFRRVDPTELIWFQWYGPRLTVVSSRGSCVIHCSPRDAYPEGVRAPPTRVQPWRKLLFF